LIDLNAFEVKSTLNENSQITSLAFSKDVSRLALAKFNGEVMVYDTTMFKRLQTFQGNDSFVHYVCFSPSGRLLASSCCDFKIRIWSLENFQLVKVLESDLFYADSLTFLDDDKTLLSGHEKAMIRTWNLETGICEQVTRSQQISDLDRCGIHQMNKNVIHQISFGKEDGLVYAAAYGGVFIRPLKDPLPKVLHHEVEPYPYVYDVDFSPSGQRLVSSGWDKTIRIWDMATGRQISALKTPGAAIWAKYSPDGRCLLSCTQSAIYSHYTLSLWNPMTLKKERDLEFRHHLPCGIFVPRLKAFLVAVYDELWILDPNTLEIREKKATPAHVCSLALSPDGSNISFGMGNGDCIIRDAKSFEPVISIKTHATVVSSVVFSPDGKRLATGGEDGEIRVWDVETGEVLWRGKKSGAGEIYSLCFTSDGRRILSGCRLNSIGVWDAQTGLELVDLHGHKNYVHGLALSPDGRILASASGDNTVRLWDTRPLKVRVDERVRLLAAEQAVSGKVEQLFEEHGTIEKVLDALEADPVLGPLEKHAAWNVVHLSENQ